MHGLQGSYGNMAWITRGARIQGEGGGGGGGAGLAALVATKRYEPYSITMALGPLLFLLFINDLPDSIMSRVLLFADDAMCYRSISSITDCLKLQEDLNSLSLWSSTCMEPAFQSSEVLSSFFPSKPF